MNDPEVLLALGLAVSNLRAMLQNSTKARSEGFGEASKRRTGTTRNNKFRFLFRKYWKN